MQAVSYASLNWFEILQIININYTRMKHHPHAIFSKRRINCAHLKMLLVYTQSPEAPHVPGGWGFFFLAKK